MQEKNLPTWGLYIYRSQTDPAPTHIRLLFDYIVERLQISHPCKNSYTV